jgi:hypothetical protein
VDTSGTTVIIGGVVLHVHQLRDYVLKALDKLEAQTDQLLFHNPLFTITDTELIHDQPRSTLPGYGFVDDEHNSWSGKMTVLEYIRFRLG